LAQPHLSAWTHPSPLSGNLHHDQRPTHLRPQPRKGLKIASSHPQSQYYDLLDQPKYRGIDRLRFRSAPPKELLENNLLKFRRVRFSLQPAVIKVPVKVRAVHYVSPGRRRSIKEIGLLSLLLILLVVFSEKLCTRGVDIVVEVIAIQALQDQVEIIKIVNGLLSEAIRISHKLNLPLIEIRLWEHWVLPIQIHKVRNEGAHLHPNQGVQPLHHNRQLQQPALPRRLVLRGTPQGTHNHQQYEDHLLQ
jgi:hypothetical protein